MRKLKDHEKKLLKKVDFFQWKSDSSMREIKVMRRYHLQDREDYIKYNKLCGDIRSLANKIALLGPKDPFREQYENTLLNQLHNLGVIDSKNVLSAADKVSVSAFCRRRLPVVMVRLRMAQYVSEAVKMIEQGHIRVGAECVTDPAFLVPKKLEDYVTWAENSSYKRKIMKYKDKLDDYDLL